ncbi:MAG: glutathione S-transferase domain-containing protein [Gammaproteobacteria bacterium]|nr:glutathione S-transferase domain-containing protein [Gammaproteobacteria bacterium]
MVAPNKQSYNAIVADLSASLGQVKNVLVQGPYFSGENFSLIDAAYNSGDSIPVSYLPKHLN